MANNFFLKIKTTEGVKRIDHLSSKSTFDDLRLAVSQLVNIKPGAVGILHGFPPRKLDVPDPGESLGSLKICHGDCLQVNILVEDSTAVKECSVSDCEKQGSGLTTERQGHMSRGILTRHTVPADNSCLFTSIDYAINRGRPVDKASSAKLMRQIIAEVIAANPELYSTAVLDNKQNADYCSWILNESSWGGAIELNILANHFGVEIDVVNALDGRIDRFGEGSNYTDRILLVYDGIHYDPLELESVDGSSTITVFSTEDNEILFEALELGHEAKSSRQFTDVGKFRLMCQQCRVIVTGQTGAVEHTKTTGHASFGEI